MYKELEKFDYIYGWVLSGMLVDWLCFYGNVFKMFKFGGWVEMQEYDVWIFSDDDSCVCVLWMMEWVDKLDGVSKFFGKQINVVKYY